MENMISSSKSITGGNTVEPLKTIKDILYDILINIPRTDVNAQQQMGVQLSNSVKEKGVVIIQNQNVEILITIIPKIVQILQILEQINYPQVPVPVIKKQEGRDLLVDFLEHLLEISYPMARAVEDFKMAYIQYVIDHCSTQKEAAAKLGIQASYLSKLLKERE